MKSPESEGNSESPAPRESQLPPELRFVTEVPDMKKLDSEQLFEFVCERLKKLRQHREALVALGWNPDATIAALERGQREFEVLSKQLDLAQDAMLHAWADVADGDTDLAKLLEAMIEENPFDPQVEEWKAELEELRKQTPKEDR